MKSSKARQVTLQSRLSCNEGTFVVGKLRRLFETFAITADVAKTVTRQGNETIVESRSCSRELAKYFSHVAYRFCTLCGNVAVLTVLLVLIVSQISGLGRGFADYGKEI